MHQTISLGWGGSGAFVVKNSYATSWHELLHHYYRFAPSFVTQPNGPNAPKLYEMHQNMSLGCNGVERVHSLRKIPKWLRDTNFCTSLARFASSFLMQPNGPKCTQIVWNAPKHEFRVQWGGSGAFVAKSSNATSWHEHSHQFCLFSIKFCEPTKQSLLH